MSTRFRTLPAIPFEEFKATQPFEVIEKRPGYNVPCFVMSHETHYLHAFREDDGSVWFERYGGNKVLGMLRIIEAQYGVKVEDEYGCEPSD